MTEHDTREAVEGMIYGLESDGWFQAAAMISRLLARAEAAERDAAELQRTFDMRWKADMRGIKRWQEATGRALTWPDRTDAVVFLLEKLDAAEAQSRMWQEACGEHGGRYWEARCRDAEAARDTAETALTTARADALRDAAEAVDHVRNTSLDAYVRGKLLTARMDILALIPKEKPDAE